MEVRQARKDAPLAICYVKPKYTEKGDPIERSKKETQTPIQRQSH